jgi:hypothetical protein
VQGSPVRPGPAIAQPPPAAKILHAYPDRHSLDVSHGSTQSLVPPAPPASGQNVPDGHVDDPGVQASSTQAEPSQTVPVAHDALEAHPVLASK